jgi:pimeloyl-ACP methyl ester carboxylesterase
VLFAGRPWAPASTAPVILFLHGFPEGSWSWAQVIASGALDAFSLVAPDERGYNASSLMRSGYALPALVADAAALADILARGGAPVHLVAHDWGGAVAWALAAADDAARLASLTIVNMAHPMGWIQEVRTNAAQQRASAYVLTFVNPAFPAVAEAADFALLKGIYAGEAWWPDVEPAYEVSWAHAGTVDAALGWYRDNIRPHCPLSCTTADCWTQGADSTFDAIANNGTTRATLPVQVLWGMRDTAFDGPGQLAYMAGKVRGRLNVTRFPDNGHWLAQERGADVAEAVRAWVASA